ncbi:MAG: SDR family oxidoreductase [Myxococcota bacterium]|nr:SDR family oxidoreductase [Myxococcota bacterium]
MSQRFAGRVAVVTGAASGIGRAAAIQFASEGARVVAADLNSNAAKETVEIIATAGGEAIAVETDVTNEASVAAMTAAAVDHYGRIDAAFNNAGISDPPVAFTEMTLDAWNKMINVNLTSVFLCIQAELRVMLAQDEIDGARGAICITSSGAGRIPAPGQPHYTAAKHALLGLVKSTATEFNPNHIRCNAILPGMTDTGMIHSLGEELLETITRHSPHGRLGTPDEVAAAAVWLCSAEARWVNGQSIAVDGGGVMI